MEESLRGLILKEFPHEEVITSVELVEFDEILE